MFGAAGFLAIGRQFIDEQIEIKKKNKEKLAQLKQEYIDSVRLPRKKKKAARKRIIADYSFWLTLGQWHDELLPLDI